MLPTPAQPPFPSASNFPFQPEASSHTSPLMSESLDDFNGAATRQNAGRLLNRSACPGKPRPPGAAGGANSPAATVWASVIVVSGNLIEARSSHDVAATIEGAKISVKTPATRTGVLRVMFSSRLAFDSFHTRISHKKAEEAQILFPFVTFVPFCG